MVKNLADHHSLLAKVEVVRAVPREVLVAVVAVVLVVAAGLEAQLENFHLTGLVRS